MQINKGKEMKIILTYPDLGEEAEKCLIEWIQERIDDIKKYKKVRIWLHSKIWLWQAKFWRWRRV